MSDLHVRPATTADLPAICTLGKQVFTETYGAAIPIDVLEAYLARAFTPAALQPAVEQQTGALFVGCVGESDTHQVIEGYCKVQPAPLPIENGAQRSLELTTLYISKQAQGYGLGRALLQSAVAWATAAGYAKVWLCVWHENPDAIRFYQRNGFTRCGQTTVAVMGATAQDRVDFADDLMVRELPAVEEKK